MHKMVNQLLAVQKKFIARSIVIVVSFVVRASVCSVPLITNRYRTTSPSQSDQSVTQFTVDINVVVDNIIILMLLFRFQSLVCRLSLVPVSARPFPNPRTSMKRGTGPLKPGTSSKCLRPKANQNPYKKQCNTLAIIRMVSCYFWYK